MSTVQLTRRQRNELDSGAAAVLEVGDAQLPVGH